MYEIFKELYTDCFHEIKEAFLEIECLLDIFDFILFILLLILLSPFAFLSFLLHFPFFKRG